MSVDYANLPNLQDHDLPKALASVRQLAIYRIIERDGGAKIRNLVDLFGVSDGTIRRDIVTLDRGGLISRVHGGAVRAEPTDARLAGSHAAVALRHASRASIAAAASALVFDGAAIALSAGAISVLLAQRLARVAGVTAITYSLPVAQAFQRIQHDDQILVLTGGVLGGSQSLAGPMASSNLKSVHIDIGFIEVDGIGRDCRLFNIDQATAELNGTIIRAADRVVFYAGHTTWKRPATHPVAKLGGSATLITDAQLPEAARRALASTGASIVIATGR